MLIPLCGRSICIYLLENKQLQVLLPQGGIRMTGIVDFFTASKRRVCAIRDIPHGLTAKPSVTASDFWRASKVKSCE
jgi:hypothetical protein